MPARFDKDINEADKRLEPFVKNECQRRGTATVVGLASWALAGDEEASSELEKHVTPTVIRVVALNLGLIFFKPDKAGAEGAMSLLFGQSRYPVITQMLQEMRS